MKIEPTDTCHYPGCPGPATFSGYCGTPGHNKDTAYRARRKLAAGQRNQEIEDLKIALARAAGREDVLAEIRAALAQADGTVQVA